MARIAPEGEHSYDYVAPETARKNRAEARERNPHFRGINIHETWERLWSYAAPAAGGAFIGAIVWIVASIFKLMIPAKWTVVTWIIGAIAFIGKWAFILCFVALAILWLTGLFFRFTSWLKNYRW